MDKSLQHQLNLPPMDQVGFVVHDLAAAIAQYDALFGPFEVHEYGSFEYDYRGRQEECELQIAYGSSGDIQIELIQWVAGGCPHKEFLDRGLQGMHHLRFQVNNLDQMLERAKPLGYLPIWQTRFGAGLAVAYLEREGDPLLIELFENLHQ